MTEKIKSKTFGVSIFKDEFTIKGDDFNMLF